MAALHVSTLMPSSSKRIITATHHLPNQLRTSSPPKNFVQELIIKDGLMTSTTIPLRKTTEKYSFPASRNPDIATVKLYAILEAVANRVEMHANVGEQRENWNALLLNSINMITLTATTMVGLGSMAEETGNSTPHLALNLGATLLFLAATGMLVVMNKIQPSQLVEEQRNATRLFKQLHNQIQTRLALHVPTTEYVEEMMEKVLALDRAYPLPLIGVMLEKFPEKFEPAVWWPRKHSNVQSQNGKGLEKNGWDEEMEMEMREVIAVIKGKDKEDYERLGKIGLKVNKVLAISGPVLTGIAAVGSAFVGFNNPMAGIVGASAGALATIVNTLEHGGQVGMVIEMYRNCAGFFQLMEESIESTLEEQDLESRENGELFEMKLALQLGRSLPQLKELTEKSASFRRDRKPIDEFASKLF